MRLAYIAVVTPTRIMGVFIPMTEVRYMWKPLLAGAGLMMAASSALAADVSPLVEADWLSDRLDDDDLVVLDVRSGIDGGGDRGTFEAAHIPGSVYSSYTDDG